MKKRSILGFMVLLAALAQAYADKVWASEPVDLTMEVQSEEEESEGIRTVDHFVSHISTVPASEGERVELFVREKVRGHHRRNRPVVLLVHGNPGTAADFDNAFENYSWMEYLAHAGFDVFAMDLTGYGWSPRPMMDDPCNTSLEDQKRYLIPNPLAEPCPSSYPFRLVTPQSEWDEIDTVIDYLRQLRRVDKVHLIGWSAGGRRTGGYAARHPEKVERLFLYAPGLYNRLGPSDPPEELPEPGIPMFLQAVDDFSNWDPQIHCKDQFTPAIREVMTASRLEFDPLGSTWGRVGVRRAPRLLTRWGWNARFAHQVEAPALVIRGDLDTDVPAAEMRDLLEDLGAEQKVFVHVACASHLLLFENRHTILLRASEEWLRHGTFAGHSDGSFFVDSDGHVHRE